MRLNGGKPSLAIAAAAAAIVTVTTPTAMAAAHGPGRPYAAAANVTSRAVHRTHHRQVTAYFSGQACPGDGSLACGSSYAAVNIREGTDTGSPVVGVLYPGQTVGFCQVLGQDINGNSVWDWVGIDSNGRGALVSDYYMNTPSYGTNMFFPCYGKG